MTEDLRVCFIGDPFVRGIGDPRYRSGVARFLEHTARPVPGFNLVLTDVWAEWTETPHPWAG